MRGIFSVTVENHSGALSKMAGLFARRGFNIDSLTVGETDDTTVSSMTIVSNGDKRTLEQIEKQLNKKIDVIKVRRLEEKSCIEREGIVIKVSYTRSNRKEIMEICEIMRARIVHMGMSSLIIEFFGRPSQVHDLIEHLRSYGIQEVTRTGTLAIQKDMI